MVVDVVYWGASGHAKVLREFSTKIGHRLVAVFDNNPSVINPFGDIRVYNGVAGFSEWRERHYHEGMGCLVAIGGAAGPVRLKIQQFLTQHGLIPQVAVHPAAYVGEDAQLGPGCQVLAQAAVCAQARLGAACIINTAASVDHECIIGDGVHLAPGARLSGCVSIGNHTLIGPNAVVLPRLRIGSRTIVGGGAVVTRDLPDGVVAFGNPARVQRRRTSRHDDDS